METLTVGGCATFHEKNILHLSTFHRNYILVLFKSVFFPEGAVNKETVERSLYPFNCVVPLKIVVLTAYRLPSTIFYYNSNPFVLHNVIEFEVIKTVKPSGGFRVCVCGGGGGGGWGGGRPSLFSQNLTFFNVKLKQKSVNLKI